MRPRLAVAILVLSTVVRLAALPLPGTEDVNVWRIWAYAASQDVTTVYGVGGSPPTRGVLHYGTAYTTVDYPPVALYEMALAGVAYRLYSPSFENTWRLTAAVKLPGLVAGLGLTALLWFSVRRLAGDEGAAWWAAVAYWANPAIALNGEILGYLDPLVMLPAVAALLLVHRRRWTVSGITLGIALLTKPQAMLILPAVAVAALHVGRVPALLRTGVAAAVTGAIALLPFAAVGALPNVWIAFGSWYGRRDILSGNAANLWWIVTWLARGYNMIPDYGFPGAYLLPVRRILAVSSFMEMGLPNPRPFGTAAVVAAVGWAAWRVRRPQALAVHALFAAFVVHAFFTLAVSVHEHHLIMAVPFLVLASALRRELRPLCWVVSGIAALNMNLFYGISRGWGWAIPRASTPIDASVLLACVNLGVLVWHARTLGRASRQAAPDAGTPAPRPAPLPTPA